MGTGWPAVHATDSPSGGNVIQVATDLVLGDSLHLPDSDALARKQVSDAVQLVCRRDRLLPYAQSANLPATIMLRDNHVKYSLVGAPLIASLPASCVRT